MLFFWTLNNPEKKISHLSQKYYNPNSGNVGTLFKFEYNEN